jgi:hypothetical protein
MALNQIGFQGRIGPVFVDDTTVPGKKLVLLGMMMSDNTMKLIAKVGAYWDTMRSWKPSTDPDYFTVPAADISMGTYQDNQLYGVCPAYKVPNTGTAYDGFKALSNAANAWVNAVNYADLQLISNGQLVKTYTANDLIPGSGGSTTNVTTTTNNTGTITTTSATTPISQAPTVGEQLQTFFTNYWWAVLLLLGFLLWKPVIAPALGMGSKTKRKFR